MSQELNTILAALRYYQENGQGEPANRSDAIHDIATNGDEEISLDAAGIDELCERLNCGVERYLYIVVFSTGRFDHAFVQAHTDVEAYKLGREYFMEHPRPAHWRVTNDYVVSVGPLVQPAHIDLLEPMERIAAIVKEALS